MDIVEKILNNNKCHGNKVHEESKWQNKCKWDQKDAYQAKELRRCQIIQHKLSTSYTLR